MQFNKSIISALVTSALLSACATGINKSASEMAKTRDTRVNERIKAVETTSRPTASVTEITTQKPAFTKTKFTKVKGDINISAASTPFGPLMSELCKKSGYSLGFAEGTDISRKISINFTNALTDDAIRTSAFLAGYIAVIDKREKTVMVSDVATYNFKLPSSVFSNLQAQYSVGGNPANAGGSSGNSGGGSGGGASGGGSAGTSLKASFVITGKEGTNADGLTKFIQSLAGKNSEVIVAESGHISVRSNAQSLRRVHEFLKTYAKDAMTQVEIEATVVEVALKNEFEFGIDWAKVTNGDTLKGTTVGSTLALAALATGGTTLPAVLTAAGAAVDGKSISLLRVNSDQAAIVKALAGYTDINIMSQPKLVSLNNVPATFFDGDQLPYLGSTEQTAASTTAATPTVTGEISFAIDGVSFSAVPSVVSDNTVQITLIPVLSTVNGFTSFLNNTLTAPNQSNKQTYMRVLAESGKTLILGGIRHTSESKDSTNIVNSARSNSAKEVVILLKANVIPSAEFDPIIGESL